MKKDKKPVETVEVGAEEMRERMDERKVVMNARVKMLKEKREATKISK
jgi:hypothetical protein